MIVMCVILLDNYSNINRNIEIYVTYSFVHTAVSAAYLLRTAQHSIGERGVTLDISVTWLILEELELDIEHSRLRLRRLE